MKYSDFCGDKLSLLGFGAMRLPTNGDGSIDEKALGEMVDFAIANGVNYFDTAFPYHGGMSEIALGRALAKHPRDSYRLATKYPGHQLADTYDPADVFEQQLRKCGVEYFDFYLLHNVYENSIGVYKNPKWKILDYFIKQKKAGRIRHLGFSCHARPDCMKDFLDFCGGEMEFCQIQLNYLDWTLQEAEKKYRLLADYNVPVWVMEPVRGGKLARLSEENEAVLRALRPEESIASWAFRWLQRLPDVKVVLSGMSDMEQMRDNIKTFSGGKPLTSDESVLLLGMAEGMKSSLPCTACRYCCDGCPAGLDIPMLIGALNDIRFSLQGSLTAAMQIEALPKEKLPGACIGCGACEKICPQKISVPGAMAELSATLDKLPSWKKMCLERAAEAEKIKKGEK